MQKWASNSIFFKLVIRRKSKLKEFIGAHVDVCHKRQNDIAGQNVTVWEGGGMKRTIISHKGTKCHSIGERRGEVKQTTGKNSQSLQY